MYSERAIQPTERRTKSSGSPVQASVRHQQLTNKQGARENEAEVDGDKQNVQLDHVLDINVVSPVWKYETEERTGT